MAGQRPCAADSSCRVTQNDQTCHLWSPHYQPCRPTRTRQTSSTLQPLLTSIFPALAFAWHTDWNCGWRRGHPLLFSHRSLHPSVSWLGRRLFPPNPASEGATVIRPIARPWLLPIITTLGGLLTGIIVFSLAPEAEGHGTDAAIEAFHEKGGRIRARIPLIKMIASAITIGSGGSAGREGPTAQISAGFGSWLGDLLHLDDHDRRIAMAAGIGSGIGAIFKAPFGGALLSAEILYKRDFESDALFPSFIASVVGFSIYGLWAGWTPIFGIGGHFTFDHPFNLIAYLLLGICAGVVGLALSRYPLSYSRLLQGMAHPTATQTRHWWTSRRSDRLWRFHRRSAWAMDMSSSE